MTQVETDVQILDRITSTVRKLVDKKDAPIAEAVVHAIVQSLPQGDLAAGDPEGFATGCVQFWRFGKKREASEPVVRIYTPTERDDDWHCEHTVVEIVSDDMPFLVDSVVAALGRFNAGVQLLIHPVLSVERDAAGRLTRVGESGDANAESWIHLRIDPQAAAMYAEIEKELRIVLADVRVVVEDWQAIRAKTHAIVAELESNPPPLPAEEIDEGVRFLNWMDNHHFTFLGYRLCDFKGEKEQTVARIEPGLGLLRDPEYTVFDGMRNLGAVPAEVRHFVEEPSLLRITKANRRGRVHRAVHLDTIAVKRFNKKGEVIGDHLFLGLFTAAAYSRSPRYIPLLRQRVARTLERAGFTRASHNGKALQHILETYPRDELFQIGEDDLFEISMGILGLQERQQIAFYVRRDPFERFVSCLLFIPRDRYDTRMRIQAQKILEDAYDGKVDAFYTHMTDEPFARLHIIVRTKRGAIPDIAREEVERRLVEAGRLWSDRVREQLLETHGPEEALRLARRYKRASAAYEEEHDAKTAVHDIDHMERAFASSDGLSLHLHRDPEDDDDVVRVKVFLRGSPVPLSDVLPKLENMGMRVMEEYPYRVRLDTGEHGSIHDFVTRLQGRTMKLDRVRDVFHEAFRAVWNGETENDGFNRLVLRVGLSCRDITVLRAYCKYLLQARIPFSQAYMEQTLANNAEIARILIEFFRCRFDPERHGVGLDVAADLAEEVRLLLDDVTNLDEDRIIRRFLNAMEATVRTNFYQTGDDGEPKPALAIKIDSQRIDELPLPKPFREIFVYSPRVEAVHLRGGEVARGGIRWSDRREDFRTEVLGLMKAQMVKNAVIVPVGSKGGFVVKCLPEGGREEVQAEVKACYRIMMRAMLDITDNLDGDTIVPPPDLRIHDDDDPYLVVAADKGTATFSDIANGISMAHGFWLDDAFASGGSAGYDHKVMGITARGAWESVKRHFREAGKDTQAEDFTVVGVGDMSGDVFGNGMLLSEHIRLLAAFNHLHIFVDPDPDAVTSFAERKRLFELPRSSWTDYDASTISKGGGVFDRKAKSIAISAPMKEAFGIDKDRITPSELIQALLRADVELLWFGGIGTYVKAEAESHADVGDHANNAVRVGAKELRARVIGEGANLGMTQRARIEFGRVGGRINTDAIDNSAGVDCSDHEVNIKILLREAEKAGTLTRPERDVLLQEMTDEVATLVLRDNYLQTQAITVTHQLGGHLLDRIARYMRRLERQNRLSRRLEDLPDDEDLKERFKEGIGFTRPELSVLLAYAKIELYDELLSSDIPEDPYMQEDLKRYFPQPLRDRFPDLIAKHRLRREIVATVLTNSIINRVGLAFIHEVKEVSGMPAPDIARAYVVSRETLGIRELWRSIEALDNQVPATLQAVMLAEGGRLLQRSTAWCLREGGFGIDIGRTIDAYVSGVRELSEGIVDVLSPANRKLVEETEAIYGAQGVPKDVARHVAILPMLFSAWDIEGLARRVKLPVLEVARTYFGIGARFGFDWLRRAAESLPADTAWNKQAVVAIVDDLFAAQSVLAQRILDARPEGATPDEAIEAWADERRPIIARTEQLLAELQSVPTHDFAMLAVANRQLKSMGL